MIRYPEGDFARRAIEWSLTRVTPLTCRRYMLCQKGKTLREIAQAEGRSATVIGNARKQVERMARRYREGVHGSGIPPRCGTIREWKKIGRRWCCVGGLDYLPRRKSVDTDTAGR